MNGTTLIGLNRRQLRENYKVYRIGLLSITGILLFLFVVVWHWHDSFSGDVHNGIFLIGLFGGGCIFGSSLFKDLTHSSKGMWLMALPASAVEKVFIAVLYATIVYMIAYITIFYLTESFSTLILKQDRLTIKHTDLFHNGFYNFLFTFMNFQLLILLGTLSFKRGALLKTLLIMIGVFSLSYNSNNYLLMLMTGEKAINGGEIYNYFQFIYAGENVYVFLPEQIQLAVTVFFNYLFPVFLFYIIYLKFRETEL